MISEELADFLRTWCNADTDPEEAVTLLRGPSRPYFMSWLPRDLAAAVRGRSITPEVATGLTSLAFDDQADVDSWLRELWDAWFDEPYPG